MHRLQRFIQRIYVFVKKYFILFWLGVCFGCGTPKPANIYTLAVQQHHVKNAPVINTDSCRYNLRGKVVFAASGERMPAALLPQAHIYSTCSSQPNSLIIEKATENYQKQKQVPQKVAAHQRETKTNVAPWHKTGFLLIILSIVSCLGLLLIPTFYVVSMAFLFSSFLLFCIRYNGKFRKLATPLAIIILQLPGFFYVCGFFNIFAYSAFPLYATLIAFLVGMFLVFYLLLRVLLEINKFYHAPEKMDFYKNSAQSILKMGYIFTGLSILFSLVLLLLINPFAIGFIPFDVGATILFNFIIGGIFMLYSYVFRNKFLKNT